MKYLLSLFIFLIISQCTASKGVYWCGDHPCINKEEKEAYFKNTMIVEVKNIKEGNYKSDSEIQKITNQAKINEKKRIKNEKELKKITKLEEKERIRDEKKRIKEEKKLAKQIAIDEKRKKKEKKILEKKLITKQKSKIKNKDKNIEFKNIIEKEEVYLNTFMELTERISKKNSVRPYPDINDIPN